MTSAAAGNIRQVADVGLIEGDITAAGAGDALLLQADPGAARRKGEAIPEQILDDQIAESREHAAYFTSVLEKAAKRFAALARVEERHARHYRDQLAAIA